MLLREGPLVPAGVLPLPAPLPNLRDALTRRTAIFGPVEVEAIAAPRGAWHALGAVARRIADALDPQGAR